MYAIDVGTGQLDWKLRNDPRVVVQEQVNARYLSAIEVPEPIALAVCDVSFISITMILPAIEIFWPEMEKWLFWSSRSSNWSASRWEKEGSCATLLLHQQACQRVGEAVRQPGFELISSPSPVLGAEGNQEFLFMPDIRAGRNHVQAGDPARLGHRAGTGGVVGGARRRGSARSRKPRPILATARPLPARKFRKAHSW